MSDKETKNKEQKPEKLITSYDRKMQKRREEKEKAKREQRRSTVIGVIIVAALVCLVASFPIRSYLAVNETYIKIGGEDITRVEFDFHYNTSKNNYLTQYGAYMSMFGLDATGNLESQMYSETLTWKDFFEKTAVENMVNQKALLAQAQAEGFTVDTEEEFANFEQAVKNAASEAGMTEKDYLRQVYGPYATMSRIADYIRESMIVSEYYAKTAEEKAPSDEEIQAYYDENKDSYDSVDYRLVTVEAELPTEPTELADPVEETEPADDAQETEPAEGEDASGEAEEKYEPSEAEIAAAMAEAKEKAEAAEKTVAADGELQENIRRASVNSLIRDWLFDSARKEGDTTVIENETLHSYYVVAFENRYLDETPSVNARVLVTGDKDGQALLDEWKAGEATEESFAALCAENSDDVNTAANGGLYEGIVKGGMTEELGNWLFDSARTEGDTVSIKLEESGMTYVMYFIGTGDPEWKLSIKSTLLSEIMNAYVAEISEGIEVEDNKGKLNYLKAEADAALAETETAETAGSAETAETTEATETAETADSAETAETTEATETAETTEAASGENTETE